MSVAYDYPATSVRPRLRIIHSREPAAPSPGGRDRSRSIQQELPLRWRSDLRGDRAETGLAAYPPLPLDPGTPRPEPFVAHVATLVADVLAGGRPAAQLARWASLDVQQRLARRTARKSADPQWRATTARLTSSSTMVVSGSAAQVVIVFRAGRRSHAAAIRMEYRHRRWLVTDVQSPS